MEVNDLGTILCENKQQGGVFAEHRFFVAGYIGTCADVPGKDGSLGMAFGGRRRRWHRLQPS